MSGALLGLLLELSGYEPAFAHPGEGPEAAFKRVRPVVVILLDGELAIADSDLFHARARRSGARVILFGRASDSASLEAVARERNLPSFTLPIDRGALALLLDGTAPRGSGESPRDRRRRWVTPAGEALLFTDRNGERWYVYDRRSGERRAGERTEMYRLFINEAGEEWRYGLDPDEAPETSVAMLERQLANAMKVSGAD